jgi:hypothetical protein
MKIKVLMIAGVAALCALALYSIREQIVRKTRLQDQLNRFPEVTLLTLDSIPVKSLQSISGETSSLIVYFDSECEHCQYEINEIHKQDKAFAAVDILFISSQPLKAIREFSTRYRFTNARAAFFKITHEDLYRSFGSVAVPHIFIYSKEQQLLKEFKGETKVSSITRYL